VCGRFTNKMTWEELHALYRAFLDDKAPLATWKPKANIAPTTQIPVVRFIEGKRRIDLMRWGLVPSWSKEIGSFATFNARSDGCESKPTYRGAWKAGRRCIIPASSFFEWRKSDKQPFAIGLGNRGPMAFAGLWEEWTPPGAKELMPEALPLLSCTMITTDANQLMTPIHDRMPVMIGDENLDKWLGEEAAAPEQIKTLLAPFPADRMTAWTVSKDVGNVKNQAMDLDHAVDE